MLLEKLKSVLRVARYWLEMMLNVWKWVKRWSISVVRVRASGWMI